MSGGQLEEGHPGIDQGPQRGIAEAHEHLDHLDARAVAGAQHTGGGHVRHRTGQPERLEQGARRLRGGEGGETVEERVGHALGAAPGIPFGARCRGTQHVAGATAPCGQPFAQRLVGDGGQGGGAVPGHARVQVDDPVDEPGPPVGGTDRRMDAVVVTDEDDLPVGRADRVEHRDDVRDVGLQVDPAALRAGRAVEPGEGDRVRPGARRGQPGGCVLPDVCAGEHARHQDESGHGLSSVLRRTGPITGPRSPVR